MKRARVIVLAAAAAALLAPVPAVADLPDDPDYVPYQPALDDEERTLLRLINDARRDAGVQAFPNAIALTVPADKYANYLVATGQFGHGHFGSVTDRAADAGWPPRTEGDDDYEVGENLAQLPGASGSEVFAGWSASPGHLDNLMNAGWNAIGIGSRDGTWVAMFGGCPVDGAPHPACQLTSDYGDPLPPPGPGPPPPASPDPPHANPPILQKAKAKGKRVRLTFELPAGASGLALEASRKRKRIARELAGSGVVKTTLRLRKGWWRLEAESGAAAACDRIKVKAPRKRAGVKPRWKRVKVRDC